MKTIVLLVVLIGIVTAANSEASKNTIKKDVSFDESQQKSVDVVRDGGNVKDEHKPEKQSRQLGNIFGGSATNIVSLGGLLANLNLGNIDKFLNCTLIKLGINLDKCYRNLVIAGLNATILDIIPAILGIVGRDDQCDSCNPTNFDTMLLRLDGLCPILDNITNYLACILDQLSNFECIDFIDHCIRELLHCLGIYIDELYKTSNTPNGVNCTTVLMDLGSVLKLVGGLVTNLLGGNLKDSSIPPFCLTLGVNRTSE